MVTPEGEKLHSDSGISVDTQSLQEQQQHAQAEAQPQPSHSHTQEQIGKLSCLHQNSGIKETAFSAT